MSKSRLAEIKKACQFMLGWYAKDAEACIYPITAAELLAIVILAEKGLDKNETA